MVQHVGATLMYYQTSKVPALMCPHSILVTVTTPRPKALQKPPDTLEYNIPRPSDTLENSKYHHRGIYQDKNLRRAAACVPSPNLPRWPSRPCPCPRRRASSRTQSGRTPITLGLPSQVEVLTKQLCLCQALEGGAAKGPDSFLAQVAAVRAERMTSSIGR